MRELLRRAWYVVRRRTLEAQLAEELEFHHAMKEQELMKGGVPPADAALAARRTLGNVLAAREEARDVWIRPWLQDIDHDARSALRLLRRERGFTVSAVLALGVGLGAATTVFTLVNAVLIRSLPFDRADRVVSVGTADSHNPPAPGPPGYRGLSHLDYVDWRMAQTSVQLGAYAEATMSVGDSVHPAERVAGAYVSSNGFRLLGREPVLGRGFVDSDGSAVAPPVVVLGYGVWAGRYGRDQTLIGRTIRINGISSTVIGVMPAGFRFPENAEVWQPLAQMPDLSSERRDMRVLSGFGRLADGVTIAEAEARLDVVAARLARTHPETNARITARVTPYDERYIAPQVKLILLALMSAVTLVLLVGCANVANLLLARAASRAHEMAIRASLGATRRRIVRQLLVESMLLALLAGVLGALLGVVGLRLFSNAVSQTGPPPFWIEFVFDARVFAFVAAASLTSAFLFGLVPALHVARTDVRSALKQGGTTAAGGRRASRWTSALVIAEIAFTLVLLAAASSMMRAFFSMYQTRPGFETSQLTTMRLDLPREKYATAGARAAFCARLEERLSANPTIRSAAIASRIPLGGGSRRRLAVDGREWPASDPVPDVAVVVIGRRYFETLGVALQRGRTFTDHDGVAGNDNAIVNARFAAMYFRGEEVMGRRIRLLTDPPGGEPVPWLTVVGTAPDVTDEPAPTVYVPYRAEPGPGLVLIVRAAGDTASIASLLREEVRALDQDLPLWDLRTIDEWLAFLRWPQRVFGLMFTTCAVLAIVLAAVGVYGMTAYTVSQRLREIGIRIALGARPAQVRSLLLRRVLLQLGAGLVLGLPGAVIVRELPWMADGGVLTLASMIGLVVAVAMTASLLSVRRATELDPVAALRLE